MVLIMQSEKRGVKIDPTLVLQGLTVFPCVHWREYCRARGGGMCPPTLEANVKSLIFTIGAPQIYNLRLMCPPPRF